MAEEGTYWNGRREPFQRRISRRNALRTGAVGGAALTLAACGGGGGGESGATATASIAKEGTPKRGGTFRVRHASDPPSWTTFNASSGVGTWINHVYSNLLMYKKGTDVKQNEFVVQPDLAQAMPEQPDNLTYIFKIRPNVKFQNVPPANGRLMTMDDVKTDIDAYRGEGSPFKGDWDPITAVEAVDATTLRIRMKEPYAPFLNLVAGSYGFRIFPPELMTGNRIQKEAVGTGPWIVQSYEQGNRGVYKRNPDYFRPELPYLDELVILVIPTDAAAVAAFQTGQVDTVAANCTVAEQVARSVPGAQRQNTLTGNAQGFIILNTSKPPFNDVRVRRAVSLALNRQADNQALSCGLAELDQLMPRGNVDRALKIEEMGDAAQWWKYDPNRAKQLLAEAGYPNGFKTTVAFTPTYGQTYMSSIERGIGDFRQVGINVEPVSVDYTAWLSKVYRAPFEFDGMLWGPGRSYPDPSLYLWYWLYPGAVTNGARVNDPEITKLLDEQRKELNVERRWQLLGQIQKLNGDKQYVVGVTTGVNSSFWAPWLRGYRPHIEYTKTEYMLAWDDRK